MNRFFKIILVFAVLPTLMSGQEFFKQYNTVYDRTARDIWRNASTGEYLIVGASNNSNQADADLYVMRTDANGNLLWDTVYGGAKPEYAYHMVATTGGDYIVVGYTQSFGGGDYDIYLLKLNAKGVKLAERNVDFNGKNDEARQVIRASDGNYLVVGSTGMPPSSSTKSQIVLLKIDENLNNVGNAVTFGGSEDDYGLCLAATGDGGVLVGGQKRTGSALGLGDAYIAKLNSSLGEEWSKTYGSSDLDQEVVGLVVNTANNTAMLAIRDSIPGLAMDGNIDVLLQKVDLAANGTVMATARYGGDDKDTPKTIMPTSDGGFIVGAISRSWWPDAPQMWLIKTDSNGGEEWIYSYGDLYEHDHCHMIKEDYDGHYIAVGHQRNGPLKLSFLRTNSSGNVGIKETSKQLAGINIFPNPSTGGSFSIRTTDAGEYRVQIVDVMGREIYADVVNAQQGSTFVVQIPVWEAGIYIVNVTGEKGTSATRLVVE